MSFLDFFSCKKRSKKKKDKIRSYMRERKRAVSKEQKNADGIEVFNQIEKMTDFHNAEVVLLYWSTKSELPTHDFVKKWSKKKTILLPCVKGDALKLKRFISYENLVEGETKNKEPKTEDYIGKVDLAVIPGIAFDKKKNRMGRGRGYYDRFLSDKNIPTYGVCFHFQLMDKVPTRRKDVKMDKIVTPKKVIE